MMFEIVVATQNHIENIAANMREADVNEVFASSGLSPHDALARSLKNSSHAWVGLVDGKAEFMSGIGELNVLAGIAAPWMLGTNAVETHRNWFLRHSLKWRDQMLQRYNLLMNMVDVRHTQSIRWLKWLGARFDQPILVGEYEFMIFKIGPANV